MLLIYQVKGQIKNVASWCDSKLNAVYLYSSQSKIPVGSNMDIWTISSENSSSRCWDSSPDNPSEFGLKWWSDSQDASVAGKCWTFLALCRWWQIAALKVKWTNSHRKLCSAIFFCSFVYEALWRSSCLWPFLTQLAPCWFWFRVDETM